MNYELEVMSYKVQDASYELRDTRYKTASSLADDSTVQNLDRSRIVWCRTAWCIDITQLTVSRRRPVLEFRNIS
jgi:hypothetical protein